MLSILLAGQAMASMDGSILAVAAPSLRDNLHASDAELQLVVAMYTLAFAALVVMGARLGDVLGRRRAFLVGLAGFTLASLAGGLAPSPSALIAARAFQGAAGALMTPQVLSIIQLEFEGESRARAIGAYSLILAVGVAAGQVLGGLLVGSNLVADAWRPALLINVPVGALLLLTARRRLPPMPPGPPRQLDMVGASVLAAALLALVTPLTFGREAGWPAWAWACLAGCLPAFAAFVALERRVRSRGGDPLFDLRVLELTGVSAGVVAIILIMGCYAGFLLSLTIHLQDGLGFTALRAGVIFVAYAAGVATASLTWTRVRPSARDRLPGGGALAMAAALLAVGLVASGGSWPVALASPLLFVAGVGHACGFSPLANRLTSSVQTGQIADLSGLIITASLVGSVLGVATFAGIYLGAAADGSARALAVTTAVIAAVLVVTAACAVRALAPTSAARGLARATSSSLVQRDRR
ncbi:MAG TPA: MFS transporter [Chloroflexota bacterium]|nr:MFS transporter [Chloroflexota bacterium]